MNKTVTKLSALAILTSVAFSSQSSILQLSGEVNAVVAPFSPANDIVDTSNDPLGFNISAFVESEVPYVDENIEAPFTRYNASEADAYANDLGEFRLFTSARGDASSHSTITQKYIADTGAGGDFVFDFHIESGALFSSCSDMPLFNDGELFPVATIEERSVVEDEFNPPMNIGNPFCENAFADAYYEIDISFSSMLDSNLNRSLFRSEVLISSDISGSTVVESGEALGDVAPGVPFGNGIAYFIEEQSKSITLNDLLAGDTVEVVYEITMRSSSVNGSQIEPVYFDDFLVVNAPFSSAAFGDPSGLNGPGTTSTSFRAVPAPVSAPGNLLILGLGIAALAFARKTKAK